MKIGELARRTGVSVKALHHYEEEGLLQPSARTPAGHRLYDSSDLEKLQHILALRSLGLSLAEVRTALQGDVRTVLQERHNALLRTLARVQGQCRVMAALLARLEEGHPFTLEEVEEVYDQQTPCWRTEVMERYRERIDEMGAEAFMAARRENRTIVLEAGALLNRGVPPQDPAVRALAERIREVRHRLTGDDLTLAAGLRRLNDEGFAGGAAHCTDPRVIQYLQSALEPAVT